MRRAAGILPLLVVACGGPQTAGRAQPTASVSASAAGGGDPSAPPLAPHRVALGEARPTPLALSSLLPVAGAESVLAVSQFSDRDQGYAQILDGATLGATIALGDEPLFNAFARSDGILLATTAGNVVCLSKLPATATGTVSLSGLARTCELKDGDALVPVGDRFVAVWAEPEDEAKEKREVPSSDPTPPKPKPKPKPPKKPGKKPNPRSRPEPKVASSPKKLAVIRQSLTPEGALDGADVVTELTFVSPMPGMDVVTASPSGAAGDRVRVLFYEHTGPAKGRPKNVIGKSRLALASFDEKGDYDPSSRRALPDDDLMFGYLSAHQDPRVLSTAKGSIYIGTMGTHGRCEVAITSPFFMAMIPNDDLCAFRPAAFFDIADAVRASQKAGGNGGKAATPEAPALDPALKGAHRARGQADSDPVRAAVYGARAYALSGEDVVSFTDPAHVEAAPRPLVASRLRIAWGAFAADGSGVALLDTGLVGVAADGAVSAPRAPDLAAGAFDRDDFLGHEARRAALVKGALYRARGAIGPLEGGEALTTLPMDTAVLVGGASSGLLLESKGGALSASTFEPPSTLRSLGAASVALAPGFDAVERQGGGAIVAGRKRGSSSVVALAIDASGAASTVVDTGLAADGATEAVHLVPLPDGGALLLNGARSRVVWLDDGARPAKVVDWPAPKTEPACVDGRPAPDVVPTPVPGELVAVSDLAGACVVDDFAWASDGSLRWFVSTPSAPGARAELALIPDLWKRAAPSAAPTAPFAPIGAAPHSTCPSDMVAVGTDLCVDRFESVLVSKSGRWLSPDYSPTTGFLSASYSEWSTRRERVGDLFARAMPIPSLPDFQLGATIDPIAVSRPGVRPNAYVTGNTAKAACEAAGKRLCKPDEWKRACKGEENRMFPYGDEFEDGVCNVFRDAHPAAMLHGHSSLGHLDPRLGRVVSPTGPLLRLTGETTRCASHWGDDAIYDMVGNLDEWVDEKSGGFAGGFYARTTRNGCEAFVDAHPMGYTDYSLGVRCCLDGM
ncbi:MAG: hypothetical protein U0414_36185 [Polyangiaceae bacterium]